MTPYVPRTVWVSTKPRVWAAPLPSHTEQRAYKKGALSSVAKRVLDYAKANPGAQAKDIRTTLGVPSISRQLKCLQADGLIAVTFHENSFSKPFVRCWPTEANT